MSLASSAHFLQQLSGVKSQVEAMDSQAQADAAKDDLFHMIGSATVVLKDVPRKQAFAISKINEWITGWNNWAQTVDVDRQKHRALRIFPILETELMKSDAQVPAVSPAQQAAIKNVVANAPAIIKEDDMLKKVEEVKKSDPVLVASYQSKQTELAVAKKEAENQGVSTTPKVEKLKKEVKKIEEKIEEKHGKFPWWMWVVIAIGGTTVLGGSIAAAVALSKRR